MTTYLGKSCSFGLPRVPIVNCHQFMYLVSSPFGFEGRMWDLIVSVPDHCLSFYFEKAFDTLSWPFIHKVLTFFNFGPSINRHFVLIKVVISLLLLM